MRGRSRRRSDPRVRTTELATAEAAEDAEPAFPETLRALRGDAREIRSDAGGEELMHA